MSEIDYAAQYRDKLQQGATFGRFVEERLAAHGFQLRPNYSPSDLVGIEDRDV